MRYYVLAAALIAGLTFPARSEGTAPQSRTHRTDQAAQRMTIANCEQLSTSFDQIVCAKPDLRKADAQVQSHVVALIASERDHFHCTWLHWVQAEWDAWLTAKYTNLTITNLNRQVIEGQIASAFAMRNAELALLDHPRAMNAMPVDVPPGWWSIDIQQVLHRSDVRIHGFFVHSGRSLVIATGPALEGYHPGNHAGQHLFLDAVTGRAITDAKRQPAFYDASGVTEGKAYQAAGLTPLDTGNAMFGVPLSKHIAVAGQSDNCPDLVREPIVYDHGLDDGEGSGFYIVRRLEHPENFGYNPRCARGNGDGWTADFTPEYLLFIGRLSDGTLLGVIGDRYLVRFMPDLWSPFFSGRSNLVIMPRYAIDKLAHDDDGLPLQAVKAAVDSAAKLQMSEGRRRDRQ